MMCRAASAFSFHQPNPFVECSCKPLLFFTFIYAEVTDKKISKDMDNLMAVRMMYGTGKWYKRQELPKETNIDNE